MTNIIDLPDPILLKVFDYIPRINLEDIFKIKFFKRLSDRYFQQLCNEVAIFNLPKSKRKYNELIQLSNGKNDLWRVLYYSFACTICKNSNGEFAYRDRNLNNKLLGYLCSKCANNDNLHHQDYFIDILGKTGKKLKKAKLLLQ